MWFPKITRHTLSFASGDAGGEKVLTFRRGDDFEIPYNVTVAAMFVGRWLRRNWTPLLAVTALVAWLTLVGLIQTIVMVAVVTAGLVGWRTKWPDAFERHVGADVRAWRRMRLYRKKWQSVMENRGFAMLFGEVEHQPKICKVIANKHGESLLVEPLNGQPIEEFEKNNNPSGLATAFKAHRCRVRAARADLGEDLGRFWLDFYRHDALQTIVPAIEPAEEPDLTALPIGLTEFGVPWLVRLLGSHVFVAGLTGAGKGSVVWSLIRAMGPLIANGTVRLWVIDPKGGMELNIGKPLFYRFATNIDEAQTLLAEAVAVMQARAQRLGQTDKRLHEPTPNDPFDVVVIDELANVTAYDTNKPRQKQNVDLISLLLSQGRAPGVAVVAAAQDPRAEVIVFRQMFPTLIGLRLKEDQQVKMVLGEGARARGAECDKIGPSQQGVGYVLLEGVREPQRVRAAYVSDSDIKDMRERFAPTPRLAVVAA